MVELKAKGRKKKQNIGEIQYKNKKMKKKTKTNLILKLFESRVKEK